MVNSVVMRGSSASDVDRGKREAGRNAISGYPSLGHTTAPVAYKYFSRSGEVLINTRNCIGKTQFVLFERMQFVLKVCSMHEVVVCSTWFSLFYQKTVG